MQKYSLEDLVQMRRCIDLIGDGYMKPKEICRELRKHMEAGRTVTELASLAAESIRKRDAKFKEMMDIMEGVKQMLNERQAD